MFDFNNKTAAVGVLSGAAVVVGADTAQALTTYLDLPYGNDVSTTSGVAAVYEYEFGVVADATEVKVLPDTAEANILAVLISDSGTGVTADADYGVFLKLDGDWELMGSGSIPQRTPGSSWAEAFNGLVIPFAQADLSGIRFAIEPTFVGTGSAEILVDDGFSGQPQLEITSVPEPGSLALLGLGGLLVLRRRR